MYKRQTKKQHELGRAERKTNLLGAFGADRVLIQGKKLLVVDDIVTTGATALESIRTLKRAGAKSVAMLALAKDLDQKK